MTKKKIYYVVEQPDSSIAFRYWPMRVGVLYCYRLGLVPALALHYLTEALLKRHKARVVKVSLGAFGANTRKYVHLVGTWPMLGKLARESNSRSTPELSAPQSLITEASN